MRSIFSLVAGFLLLVLVVLATGALVSAQEDMNARVQSSLEVQTGLWQLLSALQDAETGQRGYLLTGDDTYLEPYEKARPRISERFAYLHRTMGANAVHERALRELEVVSTQRMDVMNRAIALQRAGKTDEAATLMRSGQGKVLMDLSREIIGRLRQDQSAQLSTLKARTARVVSRMELAIMGAVGAVILLAGFVIADAYRRNSGLVQTRNELARTNGKLVEEANRRAAIAEQLRQSQKMEAMGQLTGGLAHDFNNMLAVIIGSLNLMARRLARGDADIGRYVSQALDGAERASALTHRLLAFARKQALAPEPLEINRLVSSLSEMLNRTLGETIRIETVLAGGLWTVLVDPGQLESAILNLAVNARDAMPEGGKLTVETLNAYLDDMYAARHVGVSAGQYVLLSVTDTGTGMPAEIIEKAFDPFFTTKEAGRGTGLGLSQVHGFVYQSGGHVKIYSELGSGTTVKLYLPRYYGSAQAKAENGVRGELPLGNARWVILVVEDDDRVRHTTVDALRELGYTVIHANGAEKALAMLEAHPEVHLLFTDIVMPDVNGRKLADMALERWPDLKVLFTTGYTRNAVVHNGIIDPGVQLIGKPFTLEQLALKVHEILGDVRGEGEI
jgi:signal transduction histidine kinase/CheY-like chemotaxis protein